MFLTASSLLRAAHIALPSSGMRLYVCDSCALHTCPCLSTCVPAMVGPASLRPSVIVVASQQESCARVLLFRGANKDVRNYNSQTAFQVQDV